MHAKEPGREGERLTDGRRRIDERRGARGALLERGRRIERRDYFSSPMSSRYHFGWWMRAHAFDTVPRIIELNVPGSATVAR